MSMKWSRQTWAIVESASSSTAPPAAWGRPSTWPISAIAAEGGLKLANGDRLIPELLLVGRDAGRLAKLATAHGNQRWTTKLDKALSGPEKIFMDCAATGDRPKRVRQAIEAGKHVFIEKPTAPTVDEAMELARLADRAGLKHGVIQDKLFLPGFAKLLAVSKSGFFGRVLSVKIDAGSWIFDGTEQECQRPSWNYRKSEGGGLALDMMAHWRYMVDRLVAPVTGVCAAMTTAIPARVDEAGHRYTVDAEDTNYALLKMQGGAIGVITNSWATRPRRDDTMVVQIDGTQGSAVAGRFRCYTQSAAETPEAFILAARPGGVDLMASWQEVPDAPGGKSPFRQCWEAFLRHVGEDAPYVPTLVEGAKAVQLADLAYRSVAEQRWMTVPELRL
jgi:predicted dehydrogenase